MTVREVFECTKCNRRYANREDAEACSTTELAPAGRKLVIKNGVVWRVETERALMCKEGAELRVVPTFSAKRTPADRRRKTWHPTVHDAPKLLDTAQAADAIWAIGHELRQLNSKIEDAEKRKRWFEKFIKEEEKKNNA